MNTSYSRNWKSLSLILGYIQDLRVYGEYECAIIHVNTEFGKLRTDIFEQINELFFNSLGRFTQWHKEEQ